MKVHEKVKRIFSYLMFCVCHSVCAPYMCKNFRGHKESDPLGLELERGVSLYVGAGNWEQ